MLTLFPHLTNSDFDLACQHLLQRFHLHSHKQESWTSVEAIHQSEPPYLQITKPLKLPPPSNHSESSSSSTTTTTKDNEIEANDEHSELEDSDEETLLTSSSSSSPQPHPEIHYSILLSPTYRVPVLYIHISDPLYRYPPTMDVLSSYIIPAHFRAQTENVGVMGGITVTDHPVTNRPVFFIHPCRTAEVMEASVGQRELSAEEYLIVWIGALGGGVGLDVPLGLVSDQSQSMTLTAS